MKKWYLRCLGCNMYSILTEIWRDDKGILVERDDDKYRYYINNEELSSLYLEYKEPRTVEGWVNVFGGPNGLKLGDVNWDSKSSAIACGGKRVDYIDTIKISYTEGE